MKNYLILDNIRSVLNVASIFRTAECCGIVKILLAGYTPGPTDRFGREKNNFTKSSLGAEKFLEWQKIEIEKEIIKLKKEGFKIICIEQSKNSKDYKKIKIGQKNVFILGNENTGVDKKILDQADLIAEIKMKGKKESLNVSTACGVALFRMFDI